jgi:cobyrinic acid a,c-diamide synthase
MNQVPGFLIVGTHSGVGKSSLTAGILRLLTRKKIKVQPFKVGPDYIDPQHHQRASGRKSYNLDSWMASADYIQSLYTELTIDCDLAIIEGVMGLFDGASSVSPTGSSEEIATLLKLPILLVFDGQAMARSAAALALGFQKFNPELSFLGVVANRVNSEKHAKLLQTSIELYTSMKFLGYLPEKKDLEIPSRHLGLHQGCEQKEALYDKWADHVEENLNVQEIIKTLPKRLTQTKNNNQSRFGNRPQREFSVAVAKDSAFQFSYADTIDMFESLGGSIKYFSPLEDSSIPTKSDWVYLPGGYPELFGKQLSQNKTLLNDLLNLADSGTPIVAECGGLMYLGKTIIDGSGNSWPMAGILDFTTTFEKPRMTLGYRNISMKNILGSDKVVLGHEFHFSQFLEFNETLQCETFDSQSEPMSKDGIVKGNVFAFYSHIYWPSAPEWLNYIIQIVKGENAIE